LSSAPLLSLTVSLILAPEIQGVGPPRPNRTQPLFSQTAANGNRARRHGTSIIFT
jgi:hypothetical protein